MRITATIHFAGRQLSLSHTGRKPYAACVQIQSSPAKRKEERERDEKEPHLSEGACFLKSDTTVPWVRVWDMSSFSRLNHTAALSNFFFFCSSCSRLFSTPLRDAYIAHQPCDLEPPLYECIVRLAKAMQNRSRPLPKRARQYLVVYSWPQWMDRCAWRRGRGPLSRTEGKDRVLFGMQNTIHLYHPWQMMMLIWGRADSKQIRAGRAYPSEYGTCPLALDRSTYRYRSIPPRQGQAGIRSLVRMTLRAEE
ncbi:hypothetical protein LI328DRAFT_137139 [Trichoderma asperelloides]|nr:hypothetical protein LI328DRAFT_137139 [Trichoderma asperelloides]